MGGRKVSLKKPKNTTNLVVKPATKETKVCEGGDSAKPKPAATTKESHLNHYELLGATLLKACRGT